jgi:hypothetical protein
MIKRGENYFLKAEIFVLKRFNITNIITNYFNLQKQGFS